MWHRFAARRRKRLSRGELGRDGVSEVRLWGDRASLSISDTNRHVGTRRSLPQEEDRIIIGDTERSAKLNNESAAPASRLPEKTSPPSARRPPAARRPHVRLPCDVARVIVLRIFQELV
ncbi:hypothetical protein EVAR_93245_1 [Eumeta japonica]|uniref:Uncharacterized protein n=1 Tax=Eumeta variegata TaxID=151549 RepID=A0A4C1TXS4_EUMVA|nr:hypothetical protein EVAR_93245_1 [Eumeta japonica]